MLFRVEFEWCVEEAKASQFMTQLKNGFRGNDPALQALPSTISLSTVQIEPCDVGGYQFVRAVYRVGQSLTK